MVPRLLLVPAWRSSLVGIAATEVHLPGVAVAPDLDVELLRERVNAADADAVQAAGDFVGGGVEFAAGMKLGEHHLDGGHHLAVGQGHHVDGNAAAVIDDGDGVVDVNDDIDFFGVAGQRLVDGVVHHLIDQVMQAHLAGRADVHGRTEANCLKAFKDLDIFAGVVAVVAVIVVGNGNAIHYISCHRIPSQDFRFQLRQGLVPGGADPGQNSGN